MVTISHRLGLILAQSICLTFWSIALWGCDDSDSNSDEGDDTDSETSVDTEQSSCMDCHLSKENLLASLDEDPLPEDEEDGEGESEGEG